MRASSRRLSSLLLVAAVMGLACSAGVVAAAQVDPGQEAGYQTGGVHGRPHGEPGQAAPAHEGGEHGHHGAPHINWVEPSDKATGRQPGFLWALVNFGLLIAVLVILAKKPLQDMVAERYTQITRDMEEAAKQHAVAQAKLDEYQRKLAGLDDERKRILADILAEGEAEKQRLVAEAKEQADRFKREGEFAVAQELKNVREAMELELVDLTMLIAETAVKTGLDAATQQRLVDQFVTETSRPSGRAKGA